MIKPINHPIWVIIAEMRNTIGDATTKMTCYDTKNESYNETMNMTLFTTMSPVWNSISNAIRQELRNEKIM